MLEFGLQSRLGRTLELTGSVAAQVDVSARHDARGAAAVEKAVGPEHLRRPRRHRRATGSRWVRGVLERMRTDGAIEHEWFRKYQAEDGRRYFIWGGRPASDGMPAFPRGRGAPAYPRVGGGRWPADSDLVTVASPQSWYAVWTARVLGCTPGRGRHPGRRAAQAARRARRAQRSSTPSPVARSTSSRRAASCVGPVDDADTGAAQYLLVCDTCGSLVPGTRQVVDELDGAPARCSGAAARWPAPWTTRQLLPPALRRRRHQRVIAREHTSLLHDETRLAVREPSSRAAPSNPQAPNVLVATPTLEMGIDIGDLSTVMLASLPRSVASYLQRVGRAGRLTGSALNLAFVSGRGEQLPRLGDPLSMINGQVRPPATYLDAEEILRRQYLASVADRLARRADAPHPTSADAGDRRRRRGQLPARADRAAETPARRSTRSSARSTP